MPSDTTPKKMPMVGWYDPGQLASTAGQVLVSTIFGEHADYRLLEGLVPAPEDVCSDPGDTRPGEDAEGFFDYSAGDEIWIDYVADTGDGWDSTYGVAYQVAQPELTLACRGADGREKTFVTKRGELLVFGGDEIYPAASRAAYRERLIGPYESALPASSSPHPRVFAIPGNHDWYDSLVSFTRLFCSKRWFAGWKTKQERSYFALKLPHGWWLVGTDVQLDSDIDAPQIKYFWDVARRMKDGDRVILCTAEPHWIYAKIYGKFDADINENNLAFLEQMVFKRKIAAYISGDLHHYRRHEAPDGTQKITAGGGGAFLHPTHGPDVSELDGGFALKVSYPDRKTSAALSWRNLFFLFYNPWFGFLTGLLYFITAWTVRADLGGVTRIRGAIAETIRTLPQRPAGVFWALAIFAGFVLFTDTHSKRYKWIAGTLHGMSHLLAALLVGWAASYLTVTWWDMVFMSPSQFLASSAVVFAGGWLVGSLIMGLYLLVSLNLFGRHSNEAFSALAIKDWKNFLRLRIDAEGNLTIFPVGIRRAARKWHAAGRGAGPAYAPVDGGAVPELIEPPFTLAAPKRDAAQR